MTSTGTMTTVNVSNVRQTSRRTNPLRTSRTSGRALGSGPLGTVAPEASQSTNGPIGFYPAITYATDAITALPREIRRHSSLLKEVDAKAWGPEELLLNVMDEVAALPHPKKTSRYDLTTDTQNSDRPRLANCESSNENSPIDQASQSSAQTDLPSDLPRREVFYKLRVALSETLKAIDEKNHVLGEATMTISRQIIRLEAVMPHIENEISEDARWGNINHWAYSADKPPPIKAGTTANERSRREINHNHAIIHDTDVASRSEIRREAVQARKHRNQAVDSDFDDPRSTSKRPNGATKVKRPAEAIIDPNVGLGISGNTIATTTKRRKVEKPNPAAIAMERTLSGALVNNVRGHSREPSAPEAVKKRKAPPTSNNVVPRRKNNTITSGAGSPNLASSPIIGTFANPRDHRASPIPTSVARTQSSRARQNSTQDRGQRPSSSASNKPTNGAIGANTPEVSAVTALTGRTALEIKTTAKETVKSNGDRFLEAEAENGDLRSGAIVVNKDKMKREDADANGEPTKTVEQFVTSRGRTSKTSTPIHTSFPEPRTRPSRNVDAPKRSHKKGAGLAAQLAAAQVADDEGSSMQGDDEEDDEDAPRYCYCNGVSYGDMIGCDNDSCPREWFHLECVGLQRAPPKSAKWYCEDCKENMKKGKTSSSR